MDTLVLPFAERLLACLCGQLEAIEAPVCQCSLRPGTAPPPADSCCACDDSTGQAAVQITDIFPVVYGKFPNRGIAGALDSCSSYEWAAELTMTVYRCVSVADDQGFPSVAEMTADTVRIANDAQAMRRAIFCCDWRRKPVPDEDTNWPIVPGRWIPLSPLGGCAGGQQTVTVLVGPECCPPVVP